jgi:hypothetical protein
MDEHEKAHRETIGQLMNAFTQLYHEKTGRRLPVFILAFVDGKEIAAFNACPYRVAGALREALESLEGDVLPTYEPKCIDCPIEGPDCSKSKTYIH